MTVSNDIRCVYCLKPNPKFIDHPVLPPEWQGHSKSTVFEWTAPSCGPCALLLQLHHRELLTWLILCGDPKSEQKMFVPHVMAWFGLDSPQLDNEQACREALRKRMQTMMWAALPFWRKVRLTIAGQQRRRYAEWTLQKFPSSLGPTAMTIVRGCEWALKKRVVEAPYDITHLSNLGVPEESGLSDNLLVYYDFGPVLETRRFEYYDDPGSVTYFLTIWNTFQVIVTIDIDKGESEQDLD